MPPVARAALVLAFALMSVPLAQAQTFPTGQVKIIVPLAAGGAADVVTRAVTDRLAKVWGQSIVVENRPGAGTNLGAEQVARSAPDGYTLLATSEATVVANPFMYAKLNYDAAKDLVPVTGLGVVNQVLIAHPSLGVSTMAEFLALLRAKPGEVNYATFGVGSSGHLNMEILLNMTGLKMVPVHYRGGAPALVDVLGGHVKTVIISTNQSQGPIKAGQVKALGMGSAKRLANFPDIPTITESGVPGYQAISWFAFFAPAGTPRAVVTKINADVQRVLADPDFKEKFLDVQLFEPLTGDADQFQSFVKAETEKWGKAIKATGIKID